MGFSATLQGSGAHEALLARQDAELKLLETMRRCLASKVKCDREFASALCGVAAQSQKKDWAEELADSLVAKAWRGFADGLSEIAREVRQSADSLESKALPALRTLHEHRKEARRNYHEEHLRIAQHLTNLSDNVQRKRHEYQKQLEAYKTTRTRFEEQYIKSGRSGPKIAEVRDKYQRACRRLHLTHNQYVLLLSEASEYEQDFRNVLLPGLLEQQQQTQEEALKTWKQILTEVVHYSSFSSEKFAEVYARMGSGVEQINPEVEYQQFAEEHKTNPKTSQSFIFDDTLTEDSSGKLLPNTVAVDNLTVDWLRRRLNELESAQHEVQVKLKEREELLAKGNMTNGHEASDKPEPVLRREIEALKCSERQASMQVALIRGPLSELGCEELPAGCDLNMDSVDTHSTVTVANPSSLTNRPHRFRGLFRKPFSARKGTSVSTTTLNQSEPTSPQNQRKLSIATVDPLQVGPSESMDFEPSESESGSESEQEISYRSDVVVNDVCVMHDATSNNCIVKSNDFNMGVPGSQGLAEQDWFHGVLPREEVVRLLRQDGDFLVRETMRNEERQVVLSVCWGGHKHFIVQTTAEGLVRFEGPAFNSVPELIAYQLKSGLAVTSRSQAVLRNPVAKERWELNNDDVLLVDKIGRGNFGDVYKARLRSTNQDVAVKTCRVTLPEENRRKFLQEGRILKQYDHPNIVKLIGICVQKQPIMIVMELVPGGSLLTYLRNNASTLKSRQLIRMCRDAASGMKYLESKNCIHRDLAARNCLVGYENIVKISDFGMSREEEEYIVSDGMKQIPIKWTAPEALNFGKYTSLCDVWSYGVLSWEIFAKGGTPYTGLTNTKAREKIDEGYRMPAPEGTPAEMYQLMLRCWEYQPERRPHFEEIFNLVNKLCDSPV